MRTLFFLLLANFCFAQVPVLESTTTGTGSGTSTTINMPATRPDNDLYIFVMVKDDDPDWTGVDASWIEETNLASATDMRTTVWYKIGSSEPASYSISHDNEATRYAVLRVSGIDTSDPIDISNSQAAVSASANSNAPAVVTTVDETLIFRISGVDREDITATPTTEVYIGSSTGANDVSIGISEEDGPNPAGNSGTAGFTHASDQWSNATIAVSADTGAAPRRIFISNK